MFCTKCGKELYDGDRFCAHCGAAVREARRARYDDVVFNPPFKIEAERRTEEILKTTEPPKPASKGRETVSFDWNLEGFPSAQPRKTEDVDFNWDSVIERRNSSRGVAVEKIEPEPEVVEPKLKYEPVFEPVREEEPVHEEPALSIEELERELFGALDEEKPDEKDIEPTIIAGAGTWAGIDREEHPVHEAAETTAPKRTGDERFYTYNQKFDAFQELLDKERERLKNLEDSYNQDKEAMDYTWVGDVFPELDKKAHQPAVAEPEPELPTELQQETEPEPEPPTEPELPAEHENEPEPELPAEPEFPPESENEPKPLEFVGVEAPAVTMAVDLTQVKEKIEENGEAPEGGPAKEPSEEPVGDPSPSKSKLRYSDVFPRGLVNDDGTGPADSAATGEKVKSEIKPLGGIYDDLDDDDDEPEKKHIFAKIIIAILIILIVLEGGIIALKFIAPESRISLWANDMMLKAVDLLLADDSDDQDDNPAPATDSEREVYMTGLVEQASKDMETIGEAVFAPDLKYSMIKNYSFEEIPDAESFVDADWLEDKDGNPVTYGQKLTEALIKYYDSWQSANSDKTLVGINKLEIGEIRTGKEGFYALCRVTYAGQDGNDVIKYQTAYLRISGDTMVINEIKEDKL